MRPRLLCYLDLSRHQKDYLQDAHKRERKRENRRINSPDSYRQDSIKKKRMLGLPRVAPEHFPGAIFLKGQTIGTNFDAVPYAEEPVQHFFHEGLNVSARESNKNDVRHCLELARKSEPNTGSLHADNGNRNIAHFAEPVKRLESRVDFHSV